MKYLLLSIYLILRQGAIAQQPDIVFHHITEKEGLSYNIINCFLKDSKGMLWIGTYNGLNKYDGAHFYIYQSGREKNTLPNNTVHDLTEDKKGNIWGATDNGVFCLNANTGHFKNYTIPTKPGMSGSYNIFCSADGTIWATNYVYLSFFSPAADSFQRAPTKELYPEMRLRKNGMAESPDGKGIWLATRQGLFYYDKQAAHFFLLNEQKTNTLPQKLGVSALCKTTYGHYWFADNDSKAIIGFDPISKKEKFKIATKEITGSGDAATLFEDSNHMLWLCTWKYELFMIDYQHGNVVSRFRHNKNDISSVAGDFFWDAMQETDGTLWLGTVGGISKSNPSRSFYKVHHLPAEVNTTENPAVTFVSENPVDKTWWIGTSKQMLVHYSPATAKTETYDLGRFLSDKNKKTPSTVYRMIFYKDSSLLFSEEGAWIKNRSAKNFSPLVLAPPFNTWLLKDAVLDKQNILFSTSIDKLLRWNLQTNTLDSLAFAKPFITEGNLLFLADPKVDKDGKIWMMNGSNWLTYTDASELKSVKMNYQDSAEVDDGYFTNMTIDRKGDLWMSKKGDGLIYYNPSKKISKQYKQQDGLVMNHIMAVAQDGDGKIWSACYNQFSVYNPQLNSFYNFTLPLSSNNYAYVNFMATLQNGNIIANVAGDIVEFFTEKLKLPQVENKPLISVVTVNGEDSNFYSSKALQLAPYENSLRIKFGMLTDNVMTPYEMQYLLENAEKNWSISSSNFEVSYNNLPPGNYTFKVKAVAKDKSWQTGETVFSINISTPYYKAWWFWVLIMALLVAVIYMVYRYRIQQQHQVFHLKSKADSLEKEKTLIQYESLKQHLNPHFLFNSLTSLRSLIKTDSKAAAGFLDGMSKIYRYVLKSGEQELVLLQDEIGFVTTFADLQQVRFGHGLRVNIHIDDAHNSRYIAPVVLQNLVENALKHNTTATDEPLTIEIFSEDDHVVVRNNLQRYRTVETSNNSGIASLKKLYSFYTERPIEIIDDKHFFTVRIPLL